MTDKTGLKRQYKYVGESTKIAIGVVVAVIVIGAGGMFLHSQSNSNFSNANQNTSQYDSPSFGDQINRALHQGGILPGGDGGGG